MSELTRLDYDTEGNMVPRSNGMFVKYADHAAAVAELRKNAVETRDRAAAALGGRYKPPGFVPALIEAGILSLQAELKQTEAAYERAIATSVWRLNKITELETALAARERLEALLESSTFALRLVKWFGSQGEIDGDICGKPELNGKSVSYFVDAAIQQAKPDHASK